MSKKYSLGLFASLLLFCVLPFANSYSGSNPIPDIHKFNLELLARVDKDQLDLVRSLHDNRNALQARLDLVSQAEYEITAQYYEIEDDNFALAGLALLREISEKRGVKVRVIFDNHEMNLPMEYLAAVLRTYQNPMNPNFEIRIYNPFNIFIPLRTLNNRMHDKVMTIDVKDVRLGHQDDGKGILITGGRNASNGYFERSVLDDNGKNETQYQDMDMMVRGRIAPQQAKQYFNDLWEHSWVENLSHSMMYFSYNNLHGKSNCHQGKQETPCGPSLPSLIKRYNLAEQKLTAALSAAKNGFKFRPTDPDSSQMKIGMFSTDEWFSQKSAKVERMITKFVFDPAKDPSGNSVRKDLNGTAKSVYDFIKYYARQNVTIVTPYLVSTPEQLALFQYLIDHKIDVTMITNSDVSNDVQFAQAGFEKTAPKLAAMGVKLRIYKGPETLHEKHVVIDMKASNRISDRFSSTGELADFEVSQVPGIYTLGPFESYELVKKMIGKSSVRGVFVGSFNWDFRSQNINRETGLLVLNSKDSNHADEHSINLDKLVDKLLSLKLHSCPVDGNMNILGGCELPKPSNYSETRKTIDQDKGEPGYSLVEDFL